MQPLHVRRLRDVPGKDQEAPFPVAGEELMEMARARRGLVQDFEAGDSLAKLGIRREVFVTVDGIRDEDTRSVFCSDTAGEQIALLKDIFEFRHADARLVHDVFRGPPTEESRELVVEGNELLCDLVSLVFVCLQDLLFRGALDHGCDFPAEVVGILHADVHALAGFWGMRVYGVAGEENAVAFGEGGADALADAVGGPPVAVAVV